MTTSSRPFRLPTMLALLASVLVAVPGRASGQVPYERILDAASEPEHWLTYSGT